ncbi:hypothetical protein [Lignipirellula cremea]|uniref:Uncharacterized protein n=1 Tax=Lignipirellula cremea TaxID=2528010 RepID=A0A518E2P4_9BACT|nr:hypothetical protein [Lignipirellula cremea]QDU98360.1 hypothetical protein Pla8534_62280 [Lignipirellula cremea]
MKRLAFFTLEGLVRQGQHEVWVPVGRFSSAEAAATAAGSCRQFAQTRVLPYFRDSGMLPVATNGDTAPRTTSRPHIKPAAFNVTVA